MVLSARVSRFTYSDICVDITPILINFQTSKQLIRSRQDRWFIHSNAVRNDRYVMLMKTCAVAADSDRPLHSWVTVLPPGRNSNANVFGTILALCL